VEAAPALESFNPATGERIGSVAIAVPDDVVGAVEHAAGVQPLWATLRLGDRARYMARAAQAVIDEFDELVEVIGAEQGRPRAEAEVMELLAAVETLQWLAEHGPATLAGERIRFARTQHPVKRGRWTYEPLGVVGVLGPATEPFATPLGDVAVALMAGNGVVLKPSPHVPLCASRGSSRAPACRRGCCTSCTATPTRERRSSPALSTRSASPARHGPGARSVRRAHAG
jgi:succinate-semialdehyde dehydrogenase / glutarate-semialdehyde dehydrogenase